MPGKAPVTRCLMAKLNEPEIRDRITSAPGWDRLGDMLVRTWQFASYRRALEFLNQVAAIAEAEKHYPDVILSFRTVRVELATHSAGGLTPADFALAGRIDSLPTDR